MRFDIAILAAALAAVCPAAQTYQVRDRAEITSLNGDWDFELAGRRGKIRVPGTWETQGWKTPQYGCVVDDMTGVYSRTFDYDSRWNGRRVVLRFDGVLFGLEVEINGKAVGTNDGASAFNLVQFDITDVLREGENEIVCRVRSRSRTWLLDTNDDWGICGIFRDVEILYVPAQAWYADVAFTSEGTNWQAKVEVAGPRKDAAKATVMIRGESKCGGIKPWSPERPNLYDLVVSLELDGKTIQRATERVGFRDVEMRSDGIYANGRKIFIKGVNWCEIDPVEGRALSFETFYRNMALMKEAGINAIRTAHYPFSPKFYDLADSMGFWIIDEVPIATRGRDLLADDAMRGDLIARAERTIRRDKNHPCVLAWSCGNENKVTANTIAVLDFMKEKDPTRPRLLPMRRSIVRWAHEQDKHHDFGKHVDIYSGHYLTMKDMKKLEKAADKPIMMTEFAHSRKNLENFEEAFAYMKNHPDKWIGGCVWQWRDQAILHDAAKWRGLDDEIKHWTGDGKRKWMKAEQGKWLDDGRIYDNWGFNGCDGIICADMEPKEQFWRVKAAYTAPSGAPAPEDVFRRPPQSAKTGVFWHWMGSSISKEGIEKDLDWFKRSGIGTAVVFALSDTTVPWAAQTGNPPGGKVVAFTPRWWSLFKFACEEAEKRGIELGLHNSPGYTSSGGPWVPPEFAMREIVFNVTNAEEQISLEANAAFPVELGLDGSFGMPRTPARRTDLKEIGVVEGVRIQHIPMGAFNQPAQEEMRGLECDKMNPDAVRFHIDMVLGDMKKHLGEQVGRGLKFIHLDSYEAGTPSWTPRMLEEFKARRGYDALPFLPVLGGFKVSAAPDAASEDKFKADFARTVKDLYRDVFFKTMRERIHAAGLEFVCEPYTGPFDSRECAEYVDAVMTEFWLKPFNPRNLPSPLGWNEWTRADGSRHNIVAAEAFTAKPENCRWDETPSKLKAPADWQFARGVNKMFLHCCPLQPWDDDVKPGKAMGRWGTHFGRNQTWAESGKGFFDYLNRCQALLQWGVPSEERCTIESSSPDEALVSVCAREADGKCVFFVANHSAFAAELKLALPPWTQGARLFNPVSGKILPLEIAEERIELVLSSHGAAFVEASREGRGETVGGSKKKVQHREWRVRPEKWLVDLGGAEVEMPELTDWTFSKDPRLKYFSGTAVYHATFDMDGVSSGKQVLSLGESNGQIARVFINGIDIGVSWCEPYELEIPAGTLAEKNNTIDIEWTNTWANRLIGDEQEPPDCEMVEAPYPGGWYLKRFPDWFATGIRSRPSKGRKCFTDWNYFTKDSPLTPSGLLGPVAIRSF